MAKRGNKRKRNTARASEQVQEQELGLITDTSHHTGNLYAHTFQQIYEDYSHNRIPKDKEERDIWLKFKHSGLPKIATRPTIFPYRDMVVWIFFICTRDRILMKKDGSSLVSFGPLNYAAVYQMPISEVNADEAYMKKFS